MINLEEFQPVLEAAILQDPEAIETVNLVLKPYLADDVETITQKMLIYFKLHFGRSMGIGESWQEGGTRAFAGSQAQCSGGAMVGVSAYYS